MKYRKRIYYTEEQKSLMWDRWQKGESLESIVQFFDRHHSSVQRILADTGGIRPAPRRRSRLALTLAEREEISRGLAGCGGRQLASSVFNNINQNQVPIIVVVILLCEALP